jgi:hypothetical protein
MKKIKIFLSVFLISFVVSAFGNKLINDPSISGNSVSLDSLEQYADAEGSVSLSKYVDLNICVKTHIEDNSISNNELVGLAEKLYGSKNKEKCELAAALELAALARKEAILQNWFIGTFIKKKPSISPTVGGKQFTFTMQQLQDFQRELKNIDEFFEAILDWSLNNLNN